MYLYEQYHNGGLAEYVKAPAWTLHHLPDEIPFDIGAKIGTVAVAYRAIKCAETKPGRILIVTAATGGTGAPPSSARLFLVFLGPSQFPGLEKILKW